MKKLLLACLLFTGWSQAQNITFKDSAFKKYLVNYSKYKTTIIDKNSDGEISYDEAKEVQSLNLWNHNLINYIVSIDGIENFQNLKHLELELTDSLNQLDLTELTKLTYVSLLFNRYVKPIDLINVNWQGIKSDSVSISSNRELNTVDLKQNIQLTFLEISDFVKLSAVPENINLETFKSYQTINSFYDFSNNIKLKMIDLSYNKNLTEIDISKNPNLYLVILDENNLKKIDFSNNLLLQAIKLEDTNLLNLNISKNSQLSFLNLAAPNVTNLDLSNNKLLTELALHNLNLNEIDVSYTNLKSIYLSNCKNLNNLLIKNGVIIEDIKIENTDSLKFICADQQEVSKFLDYLKKQNLSGIQINSYCSFTPGGDFHTISGKVKYDENNNGCDSNDFSIPFLNLTSTENDTLYSITNTSSVGNYNLFSFGNKVSLNLSLDKDLLFLSNPNQVTWQVNKDTTINFCITPNGIHNDLEIVLSPIGPARPGFDSKYQVTYKNKGNQTLSGDFTVEYNDNVLDLVASSLNAVSTGKLGKLFVDLKPFEISASDTIVFKVNSPIEVPAVNIGDTLKFITTINPLQGDEKPEDNVAKFNQIVVGAYDPNIITCLQGNVLPSKEIGKTLHYTIDFENTGNYPAENIVVVETIDPKKYDINSIQILNTSHPMKLRIEGNKVEYYFQNIDLGEHKHGNILLKLRALSNLIEGDTVNKQANIYFDYNAPVETNKETTVYKDQLLASIKGITLDESIIAYPNPNNGVFTLKAANQISSVEIYDLHGRSIQTIIVNDFTNKIDLSNQDAGIYLVKVTTSTGANVLEIKKD